MLKKVLITLFSILLVVVISACDKPKGDPKLVLEKYYQNIIDGNFEGAYALLSEDTKKRFPKDDFMELQILNREEFTLKSVKVEFLEELADKKAKDNKYVAAYSVTESLTDLFEKKETTQNYNRAVVSEGDVWKVHREEDAVSYILNVTLSIANAYIFGKGKEPDFIKGITYAKKGLSYESSNAPLLYTLSLAYILTQRYDEALAELDALLGMSGYDDLYRSDILNAKASALQDVGRYDEAIQSFEEAIKLNANNEHAKTNLNRLNEYLKLFGK